MPIIVSNKDLDSMIKSYPEDSAIGAAMRELKRARQALNDVKLLSENLALGTDLVDAKEKLKR